MPKRTIKISENELEFIIKETLIRHLSNNGKNVSYRIEEEIPNLKSVVENILSDGAVASKPATSFVGRIATDERE